MNAWRLRKAQNSFDRTLPASVTVERLMARREHYGVTRITELTGLDDLGIPVHVAVRPRSQQSTSIHSGKGITVEDSLASALAEAIELDCIERFAPIDRVRGSYDEVATRFPTFRPCLGIPGRHEIPREMVFDWVWVEDILAESPERARGLLPLDLLRGSSVDLPRDLMPRITSNGLASGNNREEAIGHAIDELIERDAIHQLLYKAKYLRRDVRSEYAQIPVPTLPPMARSLATRVLEAGRELRLLDLTTDVGVTVVMASISGAIGYGASLNAERAISRAITEAVQTSTVNIQGAREDLAPGSRDPRVHEGQGKEAYRMKQLLRDPYVQERAYDALASRSTAFVDEDLDLLLRALRQVGIDQAFVCDVGDDRCTDFAVVRVIVPGLEPLRNDAIGPRCLRHSVRC